MPDCLLLNWPAAAAAGPTVCGGKGWNLGRLARYGFTVPVGGVLVAQVYRRFLSEPALHARTTELVDVPAERCADADVADRLAKVRAAIESTELPGDVVGAVREFLDAVGLDDVPVAVRSSATAEDGPTASFAGIHRSTLNVRGSAAVLAAIKDCWASLWTPQALAYRRRMRLTDEHVACAVVICRMVERAGGGPPVAAGVAFSCDPKSGLRDRITISAAPGLGEELVSGRVNSEEIAVGLDWGRLTVLHRGGRPDRVLNDEQALTLARLGFRVHWALGEDGIVPQDMEWAFDGRRFVLVQGRPATNVPRPTFRGAGHLPVIWSNGNLKDAVAGITSTFFWSIVQAGLRDILYIGVEEAGYKVPRGLETVRRFSGRAYFDVTALQWAFYDSVGVLPWETNRSLGGHQPEIPVPENPFAGVVGVRRKLRGVKLVMKLIAFARRFERQIEQAFATAKKRRSVDYSGLTNAELTGHLTEMIYEQADFAVPFQIGNIAAGVWNDPLTLLLGLYLPEERVRAVAAALMAGSRSVSSAEQGYRLADVALAAQADAAACEYLTREPLDAAGWRKLPEASPFHRAMESFLSEFGHRGVYELDFVNPRWSEDQTFLLEQVKVMLSAGAGPTNRRSARVVRDGAQGELERAPWWLRPLLRRVVHRTRVAAAQRENGKSALVALMGPMRFAALDVGRRLKALGRLEAVEDVFHLTWSDMLGWLRGEWDGVGADVLVADRKAKVELWKTEAPPDAFVVDGAGRPAEMPTSAEAASRAAAAAAPRISGNGRVLTGTAAASGRASGRARIIRHPSEGSRLQPGEILVAPSTDPGWTPLFLRAGAIVMEVGGYLSHGAIVAREYGLPAVINVPGLLSKVRDGQMLTVDGDAGRVEIGE